MLACVACWELPAAAASPASHDHVCSSYHVCCKTDKNQSAGKCPTSHGLQGHMERYGTADILGVVCMHMGLIWGGEAAMHQLHCPAGRHVHLHSAAWLHWSLATRLVCAPCRLPCMRLPCSFQGACQACSLWGLRPASAAAAVCICMLLGPVRIPWAVLHCPWVAERCEAALGVHCLTSRNGLSC